MDGSHATMLGEARHPSNRRLQKGVLCLPNTFAKAFVVPLHANHMHRKPGRRRISQNPLPVA